MVRSVTGSPPPPNAPNATPLLRTFVSSMPKNTLRDSPRSSECITSCLVAWSRASTTIAAAAARTQAWRAVMRRSIAADQARHEEADEVERDHGDHRREVDRGGAHPHRRDDPPEQGEPRVGDLRDEAEEDVEPAVVRDRPEVAHQDADEDQDDVDRDQRADVVGDVDAVDRREERCHRPAAASTASEKALRTPPRSRAARPRAVEPPGDVTRRRRPSVSSPDSRSTAAVP